VPVILVSLAAALAFAVAVVLQQHVAFAQPAEHHLRPSLVLRLVRRPLWLAGIAASLVGTVLQLIALWKGSLVTVQPLLVCGLLFALPINAIWIHRRRPGTRELLAASIVCVGLVVLLIATDPRRGSGTGTAEGWAVALGLLTVAVAALVGCSLVARKATWRAGLLAAAGGLINGLSAAFTKGVARGMESSWHRGLVALITHTLSNWELYAFGATLLLGVLVIQSAFLSGPIRWSLPALTAANPIASVLLGTTLLGEHIRSGPLPIAGTIAGLGLVVAGIMALSSSNLITGGVPEPVAPREPEHSSGSAGPGPGSGTGAGPGPGVLTPVASAVPATSVSSAHPTVPAVAVGSIGNGTSFAGPPSPLPAGPAPSLSAAAPTPSGAPAGP
jgi:drug/metabolite transporter (DMT)-like permease